jgi:hypothetical protein
MHTAVNAGESMKFEGVQSRLVFMALFPLFLVSEGGRRLSGHLRHDEDDEAPPIRGAWLADVRRQTSIATSYAMMARSMLQSSERRRRPERLS